MSSCPKCGAEECFRSSAYAEWQCGSADDFGEFVEEDKCLRNQLAKKDAEIERLKDYHETVLTECLACMGRKDAEIERLQKIADLAFEYRVQHNSEHEDRDCCCSICRAYQETTNAPD